MSKEFKVFTHRLLRLGTELKSLLRFRTGSGRSSIWGSAVGDLPDDTIMRLVSGSWRWRGGRLVVQDVLVKIGTSIDGLGSDNQSWRVRRG